MIMRGTEGEIKYIDWLASAVLKYGKNKLLMTICKIDTLLGHENEKKKKKKER